MGAFETLHQALKLFRIICFRDFSGSERLIIKWSESRDFSKQG